MKTFINKNTKFLRIITYILGLTSLTLIVLFSIFFVYNLALKKIIYPIKFEEYVNAYCKEFSLEQCFVYSIIKAESNFNKNAKSAKGATGLMQIMPSTGEFIADKLKLNSYDLYSPKDNIRFGCFYLRYLFNKFNDVNTVLGAYNAGEGKVRNWLMNKEYKVNNIFNESGQTLSDLISTFLISFLDKEFNKEESDGIINTNIILNL